ncbi:hypothetical protein [Virgisporangium ochraceum]|uniref:Uncharacterized protein n=1 Tax=Virgisporangium ochraceum TaxID=65505 RepID=A0A8J4EDI5_9ACTN|nr:hypothetical protein [Virgisporangium ochraceum]GIJ70734.1 hypothetical protein Voc01_056510 [Virgisporangium ochraceum]
MRVLFEDVVPVAYGQFYVVSRELPDMTKAFAGQVNGLCGAGEPGALFLMTGTHSGRVRLRVELHEREPPAAADEWEEVVEAPFVPRGATVDLVPWGDGTLAPLPLIPDGPETGPLPTFRVRYCAAGMDEGRDPFGGFDPDTLEDDDYTYMDQRPDRYLLCFWPDDAPDGAGGGPGGGPVDGFPRPDAIVLRTSRAAGYWHDWASALPAPPSLWEQVEAARRERQEQERRAEEYRRRDEARRWGGRPPGERLRRVVGNVQGIARLDRDLVDGVAGADDAVQREIAVWAARRAFAHAGIADLDWLAPAWTALRHGRPLPAEFTDPAALFARISDRHEAGGHEPGGYRIVAFARRGRGAAPSLGAMLDAPVNPVAMAVPALAAAAGPDPLQAALEALWAATTTFGTRRAEFLAEVRREFPVVDSAGPG